MIASVLAASVWCFAHLEHDPARTDWLIAPARESARIEKRGDSLILSNGLVGRTIRLAPNAATVFLRNEMIGTSVLRGVKPEAVIEIDRRRYAIGGLDGQPDYAYLDPAWLDGMTRDPEAFEFTGFTTGETTALFDWKPKRHAPDAPWPPKGAAVTLEFKAPEKLAAQYGAITVSVYYEIYDGIPVIAKWITISNAGNREFTLTGLEGEILAVNEEEKDRIHVESNYAFNTMVTTAWGVDADYPTQVNYECASPILLTSRYPKGPGVLLKPGERFDSFRSYVLLYDSYDKDRRGMIKRRMMRTLAPQCLENPIFMHVRESNSKALRRAIDQCADVGFEMVIMTFGSGFDIESEDPAYIARIKEDVDYAHGKGIEVGGYTLMTASRDAGPEFNVVSPDTGKPGSMFGQSACLASEWGGVYARRVLHFMDATGLDMIETDGPFHGDVCASTVHAHHRGLDDSQLRQWEACCNFYRECRKRGIFINTPDWYYLNGSNKCAIGYKETNFSLPRWRQILIARQNIYDATFEKTPSMGWMFVPLVQYHGGGAAATIEPLSEHLVEYEWYLAQNFGCGVQACYRGPRLYDTEETRAVVKKWVSFYRKHRGILDSDIIHVRRPDGQGIDCMMHVNAQTPEKALAMVFNPTDTEQRAELTLPLYYTGLTKRAAIRERDNEPRICKLSRDYKATVPVRLPAKGITWFVVE